MIDSHCHLDFSQFDQDRDAVLQQCDRLGVQKLIIPGTRLAGWETQSALAAEYPQLSIAFGIHPYFLDQHEQSDLDALEQAIGEHRDQVVAVGECGLDYALTVSAERQQTFFIQQIAIAQSFNLPLILHHRKSHHDIIGCLKRTRFSKGGVIHAFSGSLEIAKSYIDLGFKLGIGGLVTYPRGAKLREIIATVGIRHIVLETDAPDMPLKGKQGQRNSPAYLPEIARVLSDSLSIPLDEVAEITDLNCAEVFGR